MSNDGSIGKDLSLLYLALKFFNLLNDKMITIDPTLQYYT